MSIKAEHVTLIHISRETDDLYDSQFHCLVAISRHTKLFTSIASVKNDTISNGYREGTTILQTET